MRSRLVPPSARAGPGIAEEATSGDGERLVAARIESVAEAIADDVERGHGQEDGHPWKNCQPPCVFDVLFCREEDAPPRCGWNRHSHPEKRQRGFDENGRGYTEARGDEHRRERVG